MSETVHLHVTGMTCGGCEGAVIRVLGQLPGVEAVTASHAASAVEVRFDPTRTSLDSIRERIAALGYAVAA